MQLRVADVRKIFERITPGSDGMMSVKNLAFIADEPWIFAKPNYDYVDAELSWYESQSLDVNDLADEYGCLLYTSPSPRDLSTSRMPSSA